MTENENLIEVPESPRSAYDDGHLTAEKHAWLKKFDALMAKQTSHNPNFDDSRESIYPVHDHDREES